MTEDGKKFGGVWLGVVKELDDEDRSKRTGKCRVEIPDVYGDNISPNELPWAYPIFPSALNTEQRSGFFVMPAVGSLVAVLFERGDPNSPRWFGGWTQKGRIPFQFQYSRGDQFPHIQAWRAEDGMMIRMIPGKRFELYAGESGGFDQEGKFVKDGVDGPYDTYFVIDKERKKIIFNTKYDINIRCKGKINIRAPQIQVRVMPNTQYNAETEDWENDPASPPALWSLSVYDPDQEMGARITAQPGSLKGQARKVKGFKDR